MDGERGIAGGMLTASDVNREPDFEIGGLTVRPAERRVEIATRSLTLEPRVMQVLILLARARGRVVTRNELFDEVWAGAAVGDDSLNRAVAGVRKVVAMAPDRLQLQTIPRTGYMLNEFSVEDGPASKITRRSALGAGAGVAALAALGGAVWFTRRPSPSSLEYDAALGEAMTAGPNSSDAGANSNDPAKDRLRRLLAKDPSDARAAGLLAFLITRSDDFRTSPRPDALAEAQHFAEGAIAANTTEPNARLAMLNLNRAVLGLAETEDALRAIITEAGPVPEATFAMSDLVFLLQAAGRTMDSWQVNEAAIRLAPLAIVPKFRKALKSWILGRNEDALKISERLIQQWPQHLYVWQARLQILAFNDRTDAALSMLADGARPPQVDWSRVSQWPVLLKALKEPTPSNVAAARDAAVATARKSLAQAGSGALAMGALGQVDTAFEIVEGLILSKGPLIANVSRGKRDTLANSTSWRQTQWLFTPPMRAVRHDPRFEGLCREAGLMDYWRLRRVPFELVRN